MRDRIKNLLLQTFSRKPINVIPTGQWLRSKTFGLGLINLSLFAVLNVTGILLMFYYSPDTVRAYASLKDLQFATSFGQIIRNMHRWTGFLMIVSVFLHMSRVFFMAEYHAPRQLNWVIGLSLFLCTLGAGLTGYILLWDQKAYWGMTILSNVTGAAPVVGGSLKYLTLGGNLVGQNAVTRAFDIHIKLLPLIMGFIMGVHLWRMRLDDSLAATEQQAMPAEPVTSWAVFAQREMSKVLVAVALVMAASVLFNAPLEEIANPSVTPNPTKAIWFFVGLQELLSWGAPFWWAIVVPNIVIVLLILVPFIDRGRTGAGVWFHPSRRIQNIIFTVFVTILLGLMITGQFLRGPGWILYWPWQPWPIH